MKAPKHLGRTGRQLWDQLHTSYTWEDPAELTLLDVLCVSADRIADARALIDEQGICIPDRWGGVKTHPAHAVEKDAANRFMAAYKALRLDVEQNDDSMPRFLGRPPGVRHAN